MLGIFFKSTVAFCASYVLLSFQFNGIYLFEHLNDVTGPVGENIQIALSDSFSRTWGKTKEMSGQMFNNSAPKTVQDAVKKGQSAIQRNTDLYEHKAHNHRESYLEELRKEERDMLSKIIENSN